MKQYLISKEKYNGEIVYVNYDKLKGYKFTPKNNFLYDGIKVNEMIIIKPSFVEKIIKRKIKNRLDFYLKYILQKKYYFHIYNLDGTDDSDDTRKALGDLERYRKVINERYSIYLDEKYMDLLNKKMDVIERELKNNLFYKDYIEQEQTLDNEHRKGR